MRDIDVLRRDLAGLLGPQAVAWEAETLTGHCHDYWSLALLRLMRGRLVDRPACVVSPRCTEEVAEVLRYADSHRIPVVPYGAGSGVCGGVLPGSNAVVVDLRAMNALVELNPVAMHARVQAGMMGNALEASLNEQGYSAGHFPQSIDVSTVGGWVATRSAGQFSTRYGSIEDIVLAVEAVVPGGTIVRTRPAPRAATGPDVRQLFLGSEGTLGIVTEATLKVFPCPQTRELLAFRFGSMDSGIEAIRLLMREGWRPPVVRLYDEVETGRNFSEAHSGGGCLLLMVTEGPAALTAAEAAACREHGVRQGGAEVGRAPVEHWLAHRNAVPGFEPFLERGLVLDTIEVAAGWDRMMGLYREAIAALTAVPGVLVASAHSSHSYPGGTNLYFTFAAKPERDEDAESLYLRCWDVTMKATLANGGTISHHHGIGRVRRGYMQDEHGAALSLLRAIKRAIDPNGIMNPGVLIP